MNERERDDTSIWCYDGQCVQCDDDPNCEHHCHAVDDKVTREGWHLMRVALLLGLEAGTLGYLWSLVPDGWPALAALGVKGLIFMVVFAAGMVVEKGLMRDGRD